MVIKRKTPLDRKLHAMSALPSVMFSRTSDYSRLTEVLLQTTREALPLSLDPIAWVLGTGDKLRRTNEKSLLK